MKMGARANAVGHYSHPAEEHSLISLVLRALVAVIFELESKMDSPSHFSNAVNH